MRKDEGQSYDDDAVAVDGKRDHFRVLRRAQGSGEELTTQAQAKGAIDVQSMWACLQVNPQIVHSFLSVGSASSV